VLGERTRHFKARDVYLVPNDLKELVRNQAVTIEEEIDRLAAELRKRQVMAVWTSKLGIDSIRQHGI